MNQIKILFNHDYTVATVEYNGELISLKDNNYPKRVFRDIVNIIINNTPKKLEIINAKYNMELSYILFTLGIVWDKETLELFY